jgi:hypothetical protein
MSGDGDDSVHLTSGLDVVKDAGTKGFTFEAWVYFPGSDPGSSALIAQRGTDSGSYQIAYLGFYSGYGCGIHYRPTAGGMAHGYKTVSFDGLLHHVVGTFENTTGGLKFYIDGSNSGVSNGNPGTPSTTTDYDIGIGGFWSGSWQYSWIGAVATVRVYDRALSATEVAANYDAGVLAVSPKLLSANMAGAEATAAATLSKLTITQTLSPSPASAEAGANSPALQVQGAPTTLAPQVASGGAGIAALTTRLYYRVVSAGLAAEASMSSAVLTVMAVQAQPAVASAGAGASGTLTRLATTATPGTASAAATAGSAEMLRIGYANTASCAATSSAVLRRQLAAATGSATATASGSLQRLMTSAACAAEASMNAALLTTKDAVTPLPASAEALLRAVPTRMRHVIGATGSASASTEASLSKLTQTLSLSVATAGASASASLSARRQLFALVASAWATSTASAQGPALELWPYRASASATASRACLDGDRVPLRASAAATLRAVPTCYRHVIGGTASAGASSTASAQALAPGEHSAVGLASAAAVLRAVPTRTRHITGGVASAGASARGQCYRDLPGDVYEINAMYADAVATGRAASVRKKKRLSPLRANCRCGGELALLVRNERVPTPEVASAVAFAFPPTLRKPPVLISGLDLASAEATGTGLLSKRWSALPGDAHAYALLLATLNPRRGPRPRVASATATGFGLIYRETRVTIYGQRLTAVATASGTLTRKSRRRRKHMPRALDGIGVAPRSGLHAERELDGEGGER